MSLRDRPVRRLPHHLELGGRAEWTWADPRGAVPTGLNIDHGSHHMLVQWADATSVEAQFTLDSLLPLTVVEQIRCVTCGATGSIVDGAWHPAEGGADVG